MQVNKDLFRQLVGSTSNDAIFDAHAVNGLISRDKLIQLAQTTDCMFSFDNGVDELGVNNVERIGRINQALRARGLITGVSMDDKSVQSGNVTSVIPQICSAIDRARVVLLFITKNYLSRISGQNVAEKNKIEFNYTLKKKAANQIIPIVMEDHFRNPNNWVGPIQPLPSLGLMDFTNDDNFDQKCDAIVARVRQTIAIHSTPPTVTSMASSKGLQAHTKEEVQFFDWMARCTSIEENRRIAYCGALIQAGINNVNLLAKALQADPNCLIKVGVNEYDADAIALAISDLGLGFTLSRDFGSASTVESAMYALRKTSQSPQDHILCRNALACVVRIAQLDAAHPKQMSDAGFCEAIVKLMQWHLADGGCIEQGYRALDVLAIHSDEIRQAITRSGFANIISRAMLSHMDNPTLIEAGCKAIGDIAIDDTNRDMLGVAGACEVVPRACLNHISLSSVAEQACYAINQLQISKFENTSKLGISGANETVAEAMKRHPQNPMVAGFGFKAICLLAKDPENRKVLGNIASEAMAAALRQHVQNAGIAQVGCAAISQSVVENAHNREMLGRFGACEGVRAAIQAHSGDMGVVFYGSMAVYSLANGSPQNAQRFTGLQALLRSIHGTRGVPDEVKAQLFEAIARVK